jgi:hypothetical protein
VFNCEIFRSIKFDGIKKSTCSAITFHPVYQKGEPLQLHPVFLDNLNGSRNTRYPGLFPGPGGKSHELEIELLLINMRCLGSRIISG